MKQRFQLDRAIVWRWKWIRRYLILRNITWQSAPIATARVIFNIRAIHVARTAGALGIPGKKKNQLRNRFRGEEMPDFPRRKNNCWEIMDCPEYVHKKCAAYLYPERPCWEVAYTQCEVLTSLTKDCTYCKVYHLCHECELGDLGRPHFPTS